MQTLSPALGAMIRNLSSALTLSTACLDRPVERGWLLQGLGGQSCRSGQPSIQPNPIQPSPIQPSSGNRIHGYRVQAAPVQDGRGLNDRAPSKCIPGNRIRNCRINACRMGESRIWLDRSNCLDGFIDLPNLGQFLSLQDRWQRSGRYGMTVLQED